MRLAETKTSTLCCAAQTVLAAPARLCACYLDCAASTNKQCCSNLSGWLNPRRDVGDTKTVLRTPESTTTTTIFSKICAQIFWEIIELLQLEDRVSAARVCREWRNQSSSPAVQVEPWHTQDAPSIFSLNYQLDVLAGAPLDFVHIAFEEDGRGSCVQFFTELEILLKSRMHLVRTLTLHASQPLPASLLAVLHGNAPAMTKLRICGYDGGNAVAFRPWVDHHLPRLGRVSFSTSFPMSSTFPHAHTVGLSRDAVNAASLVDIHLRFPAVENLFIIADEDVPASRLTLPNTVKRLYANTAALNVIDTARIPEIFVCSDGASRETLSACVALLSMSPAHADIFVDTAFHDVVGVSLRTIDMQQRSRAYGRMWHHPGPVYSLPGLRSLSIHQPDRLVVQPVLDMSSLAHLELLMPVPETRVVDVYCPRLNCPNLQTLKLTVLWNHLVALPYWVSTSSVATFLEHGLHGETSRVHVSIRGAGLKGDQSRLTKLVSEVSVDGNVVRPARWHGVATMEDEWTDFDLQCM